MRQTVAFVLVLLAIAQATSVEDAGRYCSVLSQGNCESLFNICQWNATEAVCDAAVMRNLGPTDLIGADAASVVVDALNSVELAAALTAASASDAVGLKAKVAAMTEASGDALLYAIFLSEWATKSSAEIEAAFSALDSNEKEALIAGLSLASGASAAEVAVAFKAKVAASSTSSTTAATSNGYIMGSLVVLLAIIQ